jgi:hypothetical protein
MAAASGFRILVIQDFIIVMTDGLPHGRQPPQVGRQSVANNLFYQKGLCSCHKDAHILGTHPALTARQIGGAELLRR